MRTSHRQCGRKLRAPLNFYSRTLLSAASICTENNITGLGLSSTRLYAIIAHVVVRDPRRRLTQIQSVLSPGVARSYLSARRRGNCGEPLIKHLRCVVAVFSCPPSSVRYIVACRRVVRELLRLCRHIIVRAVRVWLRRRFPVALKMRATTAVECCAAVVAAYLSLSTFCVSARSVR